MFKFRTILVCLLISALAYAQGVLPFPKGGTTIYVVKSGDTLWDISDKFYGNHFLWPRLWEINPYIDNPHLIYPGDVLNLTDLPIVKFDPKTKTADLREIAPPPPVYFYSPGGSEGFIPPDEWEHMGTILTSEPPKILLGEGDVVYTNLGTHHGIRPGDKFTVFRSSSPVMHPITGKKEGYKVAVLGELEIFDIIGKKRSAAKITESIREITRGARIRPKEPFVKEVVVKKGSSRKHGFILQSKNRLALSGKGDVVYLDLGHDDNISPGNSFSLYTKPRKVYDPDNRDDVTIPGARIGKVVVLNVQEGTSTGIITESTRQIEPGTLAVLDI